MLMPFPGIEAAHFLPFGNQKTFVLGAFDPVGASPGPSGNEAHLKRLGILFV
jgi:hypothetical protein